MAKEDNGKQPFGIKEASKHTKLSPAHLRVKLRKAKVKKDGKSYAWGSQKAMLSDLKKIEA
jgi:hypothetical protein